MYPDRHDLEREIHQALRSLPTPRAPRSLAPRVMQAVAAAARTQTGWRRWPLQWQMLACVVACSAAGLAITRAAVVLWQTFAAPIVAPLAILTVVMCAACALIAAALKHVAWEGQETSTS